MSLIPRAIALALGLFAALIASQGPEFAQQYRQRLGGHIDELRRVVQRFDADAVAAGQTRETATERLAKDPDDVVRRQGRAAAEDRDRLARLEGQRRAFNEAGSFGRLLVLIREGDPAIARAAYLDFEPAVPATQEGVVAAGSGLLLGWGGALLLMRSLARIFGRRRKPAGRAPARA